MIRFVLTALLTAASGAAQSGASVAGDLLKMDRPSAVKASAARREEVKAALDALEARFDASIHSARDVPEQRKVQYDAAALDQGLTLGAIYAQATGDNRPRRGFAARRTRIQGTILLNQRKYPAAIAKLKAALAEAERLDDAWLQTITHTNMAYGYVEMGDTRNALASCERARTLADRIDVRARTLTVFNLASMQMHLNRFEAAIPLAADAAALSKQIGNRLWEGNALLNLGVAYLQAGQPARARATFAEARDVLLKTEDKLGIGRSYYNLAIVEGDAGEYRDAAADMERALPIIRGTDIRHSHDIEQHTSDYRNPVEETALASLAEWYAKLGSPEKSREYTAALETLRAKRPAAGHTHKS